ncbi:M20/M25/M40 family metallo-hydrolase [Pacificibacter marinus]|uniref:N-formyl-4-amino-5-aminomethyl-2-methylpyrimidine deformylase n=1 Tax=Pacificibacter marinus TaxID=658057 RepID=A0A1Y5RSL7_9RHOB|nr:M20/M25/M40 family metallo-hydrolase [Pacificibacter marinus]SEK42116.1 Acetylornithine deacetylase/Succinyl-diaminopimelate desuccinylase [Pacificibacter marinus]SLN24443.1 N-formyl-4-amino-5-aminomethyl-2-methylpyrimidinedeformylase [Pacificibacter marinus]
MTSRLTPVLSRIDTDLSASLDRLLDLMRLKSISTDPAYKAECARAADWLVTDLKSIGIDAQTYETPGHPMVMGHIDGPENSSAPHLVFYGHYDVQPVDPINLWSSDPFDPQVENTAKGKVIRGRGSSDDKGQLMTFIEACRAWKSEHGALPCEITFFFEGEEESGSPSLVPFMQEHKDKLKGDVALICDTGLFGHDTPAIVTMLRGLMGEEIVITAANKDLHSGMFGGIARNPIRVLTKLLAGLHDDSGRVTLPGFYDGVPELSDDLRAQWDALGFEPEQFLGDVGLKIPAGEDGKSGLQMIWSEPTLEFNGIIGGYTGKGFKTVLPSQASVKLSARLVGDQDPHKIRAALHKYITANLPEDCTVEFNPHGASKASVMATDHPAFEKARNALSDEWPKEAAFIGCGGSIPIAGHFKKVVGVDAMLIGFGRDDDQIHSPNEKYDVECFHKGMRSWARILDAVSQD